MLVPYAWLMQLPPYEVPDMTADFVTIIMSSMTSSTVGASTKHK